MKRSGPMSTPKIWMMGESSTREFNQQKNRLTKREGNRINSAFIQTQKEIAMKRSSPQHNYQREEARDHEEPIRANKTKMQQNQSFSL